MSISASGDYVKASSWRTLIRENIRDQMSHTEAIMYDAVFISYKEKYKEKIETISTGIPMACGFTEKGIHCYTFTARCATSML